MTYDELAARYNYMVDQYIEQGFTVELAVAQAEYDVYEVDNGSEFLRRKGDLL